MRPPDTANRRLGSIPGRRLGLLLTLVFAALTGSGNIAAADTTSPIVIATVYGSSGKVTSDSGSLADLNAGSQACPAYPESSTVEVGRQGSVTVGLPPNTQQTGTWTMSTILSCMQTPIPVAAVSGVTVIDSTGSPELSAGSQLSPSDLASPSDFQNTAESPAVADKGSSVEYDRPWRGGSDEDFDDEVVEAPPLSIEVFEGPILTVTATASQTTVSPGTTVSFSSTVTGPDDTGLSYKWNFDGGAAGSTQADPQVAFTSAGVWDVSLEVSDSAGGGGATTIPITVNSASPGTAGHSHSPTGPSKSHGKTRGGIPGKPRTDASEKTSSAGHGGPTSSSKPNGNRGSSASSSDGGGASATTTSTSAASSSSPSTSTNRKRTPQAAQRHAKASPTGPQPGRSPLGATASSEPLVTGRLISDVVPLSPSASPLVRTVPAAAATAPGLERTADPSVIPIVATGLVILLLLGLGAGRELRGRRHWRARTER